MVRITGLGLRARKINLRSRRLVLLFIGLDSAYAAPKKMPLYFAELGAEGRPCCRPGHARQALYIGDEIAAKEGQ